MRKIYLTKLLTKVLAVLMIPVFMFCSLGMTFAENENTPQEETQTNQLPEPTPEAELTELTETEKEPVVTFTFDSDEPLYIEEGKAITKDDLLKGVTAADENGGSVTVTLKDAGGLNLQNPQRPDGPVFPPKSYTITYEAKHPNTNESFTKTREAYVTARISPMSYTDGGIITITSFAIGSLQTAIDAALTADGGTPPYNNTDYAKITSLTFGEGAGTLNSFDSTFIRTNLTGLKTLNLGGVNGPFPMGAFYGYESIEKVVLPANVRISDFMFQNCTNLATLSVVGNTPTQQGVIDFTGFTANYGTAALYGCASIEKVILPANVNISSSMFSNCTKLTTLSVGNNTPVSGVIDLRGFTASYGDAAFYGCESIEKVILPANVNISSSMFSNCTKLTTLSVGNNTPVSEVIDLRGFTASYGDATFNGCTSIKKVILPAGINISNFMFQNCTKLTTALFRGATAPTIGTSAFPAGQVIAYVPDKTAGGYDQATFTNNFLEVRSFELPSFTTQPQAQTKIAGETAAFTASASGDPAPSLKWQFSVNGGSTWNDISGANTGTLTLSGVTTAMNGNQYRCVAQNLTGQTESNAAILTVNASTVLVTSVSLDKNTLSLEVNKTQTLIATVSPTNATYKTVTWKSDNTAVATVDTNGKVTAIKKGTANITVATTDGGFTATCKVTVTSSSSGGSPSTGDNSNILFWIMIGLLAILGMLCTVIWKKWQGVKAMENRE